MEIGLEVGPSVSLRNANVSTGIPAATSAHEVTVSEKPCTQEGKIESPGNLGLTAAWSLPDLGSPSLGLLT